MNGPKEILQEDYDWKVEIGRHRRVRGQDFATNDLAAAILPAMARMRHSVPGLYAVALGTGDGLHVCSLGLPDSLVASEITALSSSMLGVAEAQGDVLEPATDDTSQPAIVTVSRPADEYMALAKIEHPPVGHLVMTLFARDTQLGMVVYHARQSAIAMAEWLAEV